MKKMNLGRASLVILAAAAAFAATGCDIPRTPDRGVGHHEPPERWHDHDHWHDRDRGGWDHDRGGRDHDRRHHEAAAVSAVSATNDRMSRALASFDETNAGKMFDGSK